MFELNNDYNNFYTPFTGGFQDDLEKPSFAFIFEQPSLEVTQPSWALEMKAEESSSIVEQTNDNSDKKLDSDTLSVSNSGDDKCYNSMVDEIIKISYSMKRGEDRIEETPKKSDLIRNRRKLRKREISFLQREFEMNPDWDKAYIKKLAEEIGLPYYKVYKWNWDQKKKAPTGLGKRSRDDVFSHSSSKRARME